jgi:hypothetical protein
MEKSFGSHAELQAEIDLLKVRSFQQEEVLKDKFSSPKAIFTSVGSLLKTDSGNRKSFMQDLVQQDMLTNIARVTLPLLLNGVVFKRSGFITKTLITFLSQKAAKQVNSNAVSGIMDKVKGIFARKSAPSAAAPADTVTAVPKTPRYKDYGIPPDSETY